jgi:hypothetical protein
MRQLILAFTLLSVLAPVPAEADGNGPLRPAAEPVVLKVARDAEWSPTGFDPVLVLFSPGACESGNVEIELWSRDFEEWVPHPRHARLATGGCAVEDAGKLLNEIRVRCVDPAGERRASAWRVGANVWHPVENNVCTAEAAERQPLRVSITSPGPGDVIRAERGFIALAGRIEANGPRVAEPQLIHPNRGSVSRIDRVRIENLSTREFSNDVLLNPSGHFSGAAPVAAGINHLRVSAVSSDGRFGSADLEIEFKAPDPREQALAAEREHMRRVRATKQKSLEMTVDPDRSATE